MTFRIGHGYDIHRLQTGGELPLGGIIVAENISPIAHSDGDVAIHALVDALLGATGQGDIGEHFPDNEPAWKGAPSSLFLDKVMHELQVAGWSIVNADVTIMAERPKIKPFKQKIASHLAALLRCDVNIKAGTNEGCDAVGRGEAIAAHAVVLIRKEQ